MEPDGSGGVKRKDEEILTLLPKIEEPVPFPSS
jgi:hypothetical protein